MKPPLDSDQFRHPVCAVGSYNSGPPAARSVGTTRKSMGFLHHSSVSPFTCIAKNYVFLFHGDKIVVSNPRGPLPFSSIHHDKSESDRGFCLPPVNRKAIPRRGDSHLKGAVNSFSAMEGREAGSQRKIYIFNSFPFPTLFRFRQSVCLCLFNFMHSASCFPPRRPSKFALDTLF